MIRRLKILIASKEREPRKPLTATRLRELLTYDPASGELRWRTVVGHVEAGSVAGGITRRGYRVLSIDGSKYLAHRIAYLFMVGEFPKLQIDHVDCDKSNNKWDNLRQASRSQNMANRIRFASNTSGYKGVSWCRRESKWMASIRLNKKNTHLGRFDSPEAAHAAYVAAAHQKFGQFARAE